MHLLWKSKKKMGFPESVCSFFQQMLGGWEEENGDVDGAWSLVLLWD